MPFGQTLEQIDYDRELLVGSEPDDHDCDSNEEDGCDCADRYLLEEIETYED